MQELELQVNRINDKLQQLLKQREIVLKENGKLKEELREYKEQHVLHTLRLEQLQQQVELLNASKVAMTEEEKQILDKRLGGYIREIDRCIGLLGE